MLRLAIYTTSEPQIWIAEARTTRLAGQEGKCRRFRLKVTNHGVFEVPLPPASPLRKVKTLMQKP
jgi:hypothetical protein